jgi:hypothetical protein
MAPPDVGLDDAVTPALVQMQPFASRRAWPGLGWPRRDRAARPNKPERGDGAQGRHHNQHLSYCNGQLLNAGGFPDAIKNTSKKLD